MPCYDNRNPENERLNKLTRLLCDQCKKLQEERKLHLLTEDLFLWWKEHRIEDLMRK